MAAPSATTSAFNSSIEAILSLPAARAFFRPSIPIEELNEV